MAYVMQCDEEEDRVSVVYKGRSMVWADIKKMEKTWDFDESKQNFSEDKKQRLVRIWNLIGPQLCAQYNEHENLNMIF